MSKLYIGIMSGTSIDAIDAVLIDLAPDRWHLKETASLPISKTLKSRILTLCQPGENEIDCTGSLDRELGFEFAKAVHLLLTKTAFAPQDIIAIGSHGQTIRHRPDLRYPFTLQIGDPCTIACETGIDTIADFRRRDIAEGGQGAPLAPGFHKALLKVNKIEKPTAVINIGGMANITLYAAGHPVQGFDTGPGNVLLDSWCQYHLDKPFDQDGKWAASGQINTPLLNELLNHKFFKLPPPKSTGREDFNLKWLQRVLANNSTIRPQDVQRTLVELTARSIAAATKNTPLDNMYICGGGSHNTFLMSLLEAQIPQCKAQTTDSLGIPADWIEAAAFAWLAQQHVEKKAGNLVDVTGAKRAAILGSYFPA